MSDIKGTPGGESGQRQGYYHDESNGTHDESFAAHLRAWDTTDLAWNRLPVDHATGALKVYTSGGSGGGAMTVADGADVAGGATTDLAVVTDSNGTVSGKLRGLVKWAFERMPASLGQKTKANSFPVTLASDQDALAVTGPLTDAQLRATAVPVSGTFWQATQPVSGTVTATGTFWQATQPVSIASMPSTPVTGIFFQATQPVSGPLTDTQLRATSVPVSASSLPLPTGAATDSNLTAALGTADGNAGAYTMLNQLDRIARNAEDQGRTLREIAAAQKTATAKKQQPTLLHGR